MRRAVVLFAVFASGLAGVSPACAALESLGTAESAVLTDGLRWAAWVPRGGQLAVTDTRTGASSPVPIGPGCEPVALAFGHALLTCPYGSTTSRPEVIDVRTGVLLGPPMRHPGSRGGWVPGDRWDALGRYWLAGAIITQRGEPVPSYMSWRTGEYRRDDGRRRDIDDRHLRALPLRCQGPSSGRYFLEDRPSVRRRYAGPGGRYLLVSRCRDRRPLRLSRCRGGCPSVSLAGGAVTWAEGATGRAFILTSRRALSWRVPGFDERQTELPLLVAHTRQSVFFSVPPAAAGAGGRFQLYRAGLP